MWEMLQCVRKCTLTVFDGSQAPTENKVWVVLGSELDHSSWGCLYQSSCSGTRAYGTKSEEVATVACATAWPLHRSLSCVITFPRSSMSPSSAFYLSRKGQQLEPSEQYTFDKKEGGRSTLTIRNIRQTDGGAYACKATNKAGSQERELFLKVFGEYPSGISTRITNSNAG